MPPGRPLHPVPRRHAPGIVVHSPARPETPDSQDPWSDVSGFADSGK